MAEKLRCLIVEDELMARKSLSVLCGKMDRLKVVDSVESADDALPILSEKEIDLVFLDIELPGMSGLELLDKLSVIPQIIFTTGNEEYAFAAYEYDVTDFLKKPITFPRFAKAVDKAIQRQDQLYAIASESARHEIYIKTEGRFVRIPYEDILYIENVGDYAKVHTTTTSHLIHGSMKSIDSRILHPRFLKVHRSYIVNLDKIVDIEDNSLVIRKSVIPISRAHKPLLMKSINIL